MSHSKPFTVHKRGKIYYCQFRLADGRRTTAESTGKTSRGQAENWAVEQLKNNRVFVKDQKVTFREFSKGFFEEDGKYAINKRNSGKRLGAHHLRERRDILDHHILPFLGKYELKNIKYRDLEAFRNQLFSKGYAGQTVSKCLQTINSILKEACKDELVSALPLLPECSTAPVKKRGCLSVDEMQRLLEPQRWKDFRAYTAAVLCASTGLRIGEVQGLVLTDLHLDEGYLVCRRSYDYRLRILNPTTKNGRARNIVLAPRVIDCLREMMEMNPHGALDGESPVFWADTRPKNPVERNILVKDYERALDSIGIGKATRVERGICFHSHRHFFNSLLVNSGIALNKIQAQTGHLSNEMTERYYHLSIGDLSDVRKVQEKLLN